MDRTQVEKVSQRVKKARLYRWITKAENRNLMMECNKNPEKVNEYINQLVTLHATKIDWLELFQTLVPIINLFGFLFCAYGFLTQSSVSLVSGIIMLMVSTTENHHKNHNTPYFYNDFYI